MVTALRLLALLSALALPACTTLASHQHGTVRASDGTPIVWEAHGQGTPAIVLIHCWCGNRLFWKEQIDELARDHQVLALDLPGHGASGHERVQWSVEGLGDDVVSFVNDSGLEHVILVGHSMGGPIALHAAAKLKGRVAGIVAVDTLHDCERSLTKEQAEQFAQLCEADFAKAMDQTIPSMLPKDADEKLVRWITDEALKTDHRAAIALMRDFPKQDLPRLLEHAGTPIRAINSANSPWPTNLEANRRHADFDAVLMPGVGHYPHLEHPREFNAHLRHWIDALSR